MARILISIFLLFSLIYSTICESEVISEPIPGQEYVFVHTSEQGAHPIFRKGKNTDKKETAHKLPLSLTFKQEDEDNLELDGKVLVPKEKVSEKKLKVKRAAIAVPANPVPAPAGSIKLDPKKLIERYRSELEATKSSTTKPPTKSRTTQKQATTTPPSTKPPQRQSSRPTRRSRTKKEAPTTPATVLTTGAPSTPRTLEINDEKVVKDDVKLAASGTENKRSRIEIKKGPNGQEYEYEYVYYYYDEDTDLKDNKKDGNKDSKAKIFNGHDGPSKNSINNHKTTPSSTTSPPESAANEIVPSSARGNTRQRGRQLQLNNQEVVSALADEKVAEERLPLNTRFPPRGRNINTTPSAVEEEDNKDKKQRQRGRPSDSATDETQQVNGRGRNRANVRRPSLELVDSASFNTHSSNDPAVEPYKEPKARGEQIKNSQGPSFPSELPEGPVRFLGATPNEKTELQDLKSKGVEIEENTKVDGENVVTTEETGTTDMNSAMDKVALDLYAILQGTQKLAGEDSKDESSTEQDLTTTDPSTFETTTDPQTTEPQTTPTSTTTTTTTTTPEPVTGRGRFRGRPGVTGNNRFKSSGERTTTTSAPDVTTEKGKRFGRPFGSRPRPNGRSTTEATETEVNKEENKPLSNSKPTIGGGRNRFGNRARTSPSTTEASSDSTTASSRSTFNRPRPGGSTNNFNLRRRGGPTSTTKEATENDNTTNEEGSTTVKPIRGRVTGGNIAPRPLRPGPRINLAARGRPGAGTSTTLAPENGAEHENPSEESHSEGDEKSDESSPQQGALNKLRNRPKIQVTQPRPKPTQATPVRRQNPLLARRKPIQTAAETSESPTEQNPETAAASTDIPEEEAPSEAPSSTTEEPRGLNKLLAGRRRLVRPAVGSH